MVLSKSPNLEGITILIVEDVETSARFFEAALSRTNAKLLWAETGEQAINLFDSNADIDMVLLDLNLPEISGFDVLKYIRERNVDIPVVVQSAYILSGERQKSLDLGANFFLEKPVRLDVLFNTLNECVVK
jgi:CheY-like chemotaxis protein